MTSGLGVTLLEVRLLRAQLSVIPSMRTNFGAAVSDVRWFYYCCCVCARSGKWSTHSFCRTFGRSGLSTLISNDANKWNDFLRK